MGVCVCVFGAVILSVNTHKPNSLLVLAVWFFNGAFFSVSHSPVLASKVFCPMSVSGKDQTSICVSTEWEWWKTTGEQPTIVQSIRSTKHGWISQLETYTARSRRRRGRTVGWELARAPTNEQQTRWQATVNEEKQKTATRSEANQTQSKQCWLKQIDKQKVKWILLNKFNYMIMNYILSPYFIE